MAKEFKDWDKHYTKGQIEETRKVWRNNVARRYKEVAGISVGVNPKPWFWVYCGIYTIYPKEVVADAVYTSEGAPEWQRFRVALKGLETWEKLAFLEARWDIYVKDDIMSSQAVERIRINNYIGALRRGGQLDDKFNVVK